MKYEEEKVLEILPHEFIGITYLMEKANLPYYVTLQVLSDLERQNLAESKIIVNVKKWRRIIETASEDIPQNLTNGVGCEI